MPTIKTLMHLHTDFSFDSNISLDALARFVEAEGFGCVAITDHDTIEGARRFSSMTDAKVIVGEEITTSQGHLIGLFLSETIQPGLSARQTVRAIQDQGGLVLLPHPFVKAFGCGLRAVSWDILESLDAVEVNNAQNLMPGPDKLAEEFADSVGITKFVGADSHMVTSIAPCHQVMPEFEGRDDFLGALSEATLVRGRHSLSYFAATAGRVALHLAGLSLPDGYGANAETDRLAAPVPAAAGA